MKRSKLRYSETWTPPRRFDFVTWARSRRPSYTEPFAPGGPTTHKGRTAIALMLRAGVAQRPPDFRLEVHRIDVRADAILAEWTCHAEAFGGAIDGRDRFETRDGQIQSLTTELVAREP
ncbi:MAG: nuclear transport factor 2 family protein [Polyangiales bacterium]